VIGSPSSPYLFTADFMELINVVLRLELAQIALKY
jgi:hypothetical protein